MTGTIDEFKKLVDAEEFFQFFNMPYDLEVVNVHRLHILKKFSQHIQEIDDNSPGLSQEEKLNQYSLALQKAYQLFTESTAYEQKLFKVFNDKPKNVVTLTEITSD
ncbi:nitrogenase-stabilizing/protective protein NifW [Nostoc sp. UCD121]|uniref:nitrogenase-stabilizing/protective protein NifW n=1 Tax=unclassified Nostoc TaxID=2593658 RepID=UPI001627601B|nr:MULTISPECIES: nitrogenase-stabilizing/protective protein NifW [unclassified Nostoc]MBC1219262.1 nitrogenase-stabilizing/protective protein NifW [Nostoc sp. UCD120]MBC1276391.1 nitrogenase-stabilizing/protective protein NifW [Nostoc sp. UCD121]MBC1298431.1 nitrogenase-stabilizing/protective protein NifW [Nostoc sp. UCD122]